MNYRGKSPKIYVVVLCFSKLCPVYLYAYDRKNSLNFCWSGNLTPMQNQIAF